MIVGSVIVTVIVGKVIVRVIAIAIVLIAIVIKKKPYLFRASFHDWLGLGRDFYISLDGSLNCVY